jgi:hypothetical protein
MLIWTESCQRLRTSAFYSRAYFRPDNITWSSSGGRNGGPSVRGSVIAYPKDPEPSGSVFIAGYRMNQTAALDQLMISCGWNFASSDPWSITNNTARQVSLYMAATGALEIRNHTGLLATTAGGLVGDGVLRYVTVKFTIHPSAGTTQVWLDGVELPDLTLTGLNTDQNLVAAWNSFAFMTSSGAGSAWCDAYVLDGVNTSGDDPFEEILDARVDYVGPDGNGYVSDFVGSDANSTDNYLHVDENNPDDDSTYVEADAAGKDAYTLGASPAAGGTVFGVTTFAHGRKTDAGVAIARTGLRIGGADYMQPNNKALGSTFGEIRNHWGRDPSNGAWSEATFNGAEFVLEKV